MCGDKGDRKNTACYNEPVTFLSSCETEYITASEASSSVVGFSVEWIEGESHTNY